MCRGRARTKILNVVFLAAPQYTGRMTKRESDFPAVHHVVINAADQGDQVALGPVR